MNWGIHLAINRHDLTHIFTLRTHPGFPTDKAQGASPGHRLATLGGPRLQPGDIQVLIQLVADLPPEVVQRHGGVAALPALGILRRGSWQLGWCSLMGWRWLWGRIHQPNFRGFYCTFLSEVIKNDQFIGFTVMFNVFRDSIR